MGLRTFRATTLFCLIISIFATNQVNNPSLQTFHPIVFAFEDVAGKMKVLSVLALALAALAVASPIAEADLAKRSCASDCSSLASRKCTESCKNAGSPSCHTACYNSVYNACLRDYC
ncbi:hypothetical protein VTO42DRAFT_6873 [Malbranchea cinnamomea]